MNNKAKYYANVVHWTLIFALPLFWLLDFSFLSGDWLFLFVVRILVVFFSHCIYLFGNLPNKNWSSETIMSLIIGLNTIMYSAICSVISTSFTLPYFLLFSVFFLLLNVTIFWKPILSLLQVAGSYLLIIILYKAFNKYDGYDTLITHGGGIYFLLSAISILFVYNRYELVRRETIRNIQIEMAKNRLLEQNEQINDQQHEIKSVNRKLQKLSEYRASTMNIMLHDFRNFTGSIQMSLDLLKSSDGTMSEEQNEILGYIGLGNEKLKYLSEKLAKSAENEEKAVSYDYAEINLGKEVEETTVQLADAATIKQISLQLNIDPAETIVKLDKMFLEQVLTKLFSNVIRYSSSGTVVSIHLHKLDGKAVIDVANKGKILGKKKLDQLFSGLDDDAQTLEINTQTTSGFSVAKKLSEQMGGKLTYNSDENTGNFYRLEFNLSK